jgi:ADP-L-glycero-D-manno-heptose 6-epimerase
MNILITGHKGFIGKNLWLYFKSKGHNVQGWEWGDTPEFLLPRDLDLVIHCGAISSTIERNAEKLMEKNYKFTTDLIVQCLEHNVNLQYASSASVYGDGKTFRETDDCRPLNGYAWSKYLVDKFVEESIQMPLPINIQGFRYFNVFGPHESHKGNQASPITKFRQQALINESIMLFEDSENYLRDFVCVDDICKVHEQMAEQDVSGIFNVGTGNAISFQKVGEFIAEKYDVPINKIPMPGNLKGTYQEFTQANIEKLSKYVDIEWTKVEDYIQNV